jgi:hypothetical protein
MNTPENTLANVIRFHGYCGNVGRRDYECECPLFDRIKGECGAKNDEDRFKLAKERLQTLKKIDFLRSLG